MVSSLSEATGKRANLDSVPAPVADVAVEVIEGELLLYHPAQTRAIYLNPPAAVIWTLCNGSRRANEIVELIGEGYPDVRANLTEDVLNTLEQLSQSGVLMLRGDEAASGD